MLYFESSASASGAVSITATFAPGTDPDLAQVDVQNRVSNVSAQLPQAVNSSALTSLRPAASASQMMRANVAQEA